MAFELPNLPYAYDALDKAIDAQTMEIHHGKHHNGYVTKLNNAIQGSGAPEQKTLEELLSAISTLPADIQDGVRKNGGGHWNHAFFWPLMSANGGGEPVGKLGEAITKKWGSFDKFKDEFAAAAKGRFGSGWAWLVFNMAGELQITSTPNQDNPLMDIADVAGHPVLGLDVWEHAYYLRYQNRRPDYIDAWWNVVNWEKANEHYEAAL
jgi:Fe-Mn family superoxide dismutase